MIKICFCKSQNSQSKHILCILFSITTWWNPKLSKAKETIIKEQIATLQLFYITALNRFLPEAVATMVQHKTLGVSREMEEATLFSFN